MKIDLQTSNQEKYDEKALHVCESTNNWQKHCWLEDLEDNYVKKSRGIPILYEG